MSSEWLTHLVRVLRSTLWRNSKEPEMLPVPFKADWMDEGGIGRSLTCDQTFAGVSGGKRVDAVWRVGDLIAAIFDGDGVAASSVRDVGHSVGPVPVVLDGGFLGLPFRVLGQKAGSLNSPADIVNNATASYLPQVRGWVRYISSILESGPGTRNLDPKPWNLE